MDFDVVIAGAGVAGACAAYNLSRDRRVLVLEAEEPASGASGMATGTANPLMSLRARPVWRMEEAVEALETLAADLGMPGLLRHDGLLRPAADASQAESFERVSEEFPAHAAWYPPGEVAERHPDVRAPFGALWNGTAMTIEIPRLVQAMLRTATSNGAEVRNRTVLLGWEGESDGVRVRTARTGEPDSSADVGAKTLILAVGRDYVDFPELERLRLHGVKGQLVRVRRPPELERLPNLAGRGYVVLEQDTFLLGSTYEHSFCDLRPDPDKTQEIIRTTTTMVPRLADAEVLEARAGVRVTVPGIRLPMLGSLPGAPNVWVFTGLGSKGLLMAPLVSRTLRDYLTAPETIPREIAVRVRKGG